MHIVNVYTKARLQLLVGWVPGNDMKFHSEEINRFYQYLNDI